MAHDAGNRIANSSRSFGVLLAGMVTLGPLQAGAIAAGETWDGGHASADEACRARIDESGAFRFSRAKVDGNVAHCFTKAKDGEGSEFDDAAITKDEAPQDNPSQKDSRSSCASKPAQEQHPEEKALGLSDDQINAMEKFVAKLFSTIPELNFQKHWEQVVDPKDAQLVAGTSPSASTATKENLRKTVFNKTRKKFWEEVYDDTTVARKVIEEAGFEFPKRGNAPQLKFKNDPKQTLGKGHKANTSLDVDHATRLTDEPSRMLDPSNLRLLFSRENRVGVEQIRKQDPFQKCD